MNKSITKNKIKVASLFSGIGAPEFAIKRLGIDYEIIFACDNGELEYIVPEKEIEERLNSISDATERDLYLSSIMPRKKKNFVKESYLANHILDENDFHFNIKHFNATPYKGKVDLLVGGSPCQSFTLLGYQKGLEETRGTLFYDYARIIKEVEPKAFIYENVQGLIKHDQGKTWEVIKRVFESLGYDIHYKVLDSVNYGIPQKRRRIFVVGIKNPKHCFEFPNEIPLNFTMQDFLLENTPEGNFIDEDGEIHITHSKGEVPQKYFLSEKILPGIMCEGTGGFSMKPEIDLKIARPLMSSMHKMHRAGEDNYVTTNGKIRRLAPRECLRLMGFTDDFKIVVSDTQMYKQAGNSMVVDVMKALISSVFKSIGYEMES